MLRAAAALLLVAEAAAALVGPRVPVDYSRPHAAKHPMQGGARVTHADMQFSFKPQKSERLLIREAWEKADAFRPGKANWFTQQQKSLRDLHHELLPLYDTLPPSAPARPARAPSREIPGAGPHVSLLGALLKSLTTGDLALTLCSPEPPVLTQLRDWLITALPMSEAVRGLPEEQGRVLATLACAADARTIIDLGTFTGYSSIAMGLASAADARVICCETDETYARHARDWWDKAGVADKMEMHETPAQELMPRLLDEEGLAGKVDLIFVDVDQKILYPELHEAAMQLLHVGGVVVYYDTLWQSDEVLEHEPYGSMRSFNSALATDPRVLASLVPLSYGLTICIKAMDLDGPRLAAARAQAEGGDQGKALLALLKERRRAAAEELAALSAGAAD